MPVVKADAYNHGAVEVAHTLASVAGVRMLAVASAEEGVALREAGISTEILLMADFLAPERELLLAYNLTPVLHSIDHIRELSRLGEQAGRTLSCHLKVDTGLTRLGTCALCDEIADAFRNAPHTSCQGLMSHFASAEDFETTQTDEQIEKFAAVCAALEELIAPPRFLHIAATSAIAYGRRKAWHALVRPGLGLYGYVPQPVGKPDQQLLDVRPALTWKAAVLAVKDVPSQTLVGYGGRYRTGRSTRIAVLAAGYADGYPHRLGNIGRVIIHDVLVPVLGAVSMDLLTIDVTDCPEVVAGDAAILLGNSGTASMHAQQMAELAGTIPYAILCGIGRRVKRVYVD
jgi:alanine racemase